MSQKLKLLVNKLCRREKYIHKHGRGNYDRQNKSEEIMQKSLKAQKAMRRSQRRYDRNLGVDSISKEPALHFNMLASTVERFDFDPGAGTDYGIRLTLAAGLQEASGIRPGDIVELKQDSALLGQFLTVVSLPDATHVRLEDVASFVGPESNKNVRVLLSSVKKSYN
jgi:hypothetical protein